MQTQQTILLFLSIFKRVEEHEFVRVNRDICHGYFLVLVLWRIYNWLECVLGLPFCNFLDFSNNYRGVWNSD